MTPRSSNFHDLPKVQNQWKQERWPEEQEKKARNKTKEDKSIPLPLVTITEFIPLWSLNCSFLNFSLTRLCREEKSSTSERRHPNCPCSLYYFYSLPNGPLFILKTLSWFLGVTVTYVLLWQKYPSSVFILFIFIYFCYLFVV